MHCGVLTGGGDVPGLNALIAALVGEVVELGGRVTGIRRGWRGLVEVQPGDRASEQEHLLTLTPARVAHISALGGTLLHTSRTNPRRYSPQPRPGAPQEPPSDRTASVLSNVLGLGFDVLLAIGGDDTLSFAAHLSATGVAVIGLPKTMDNDVGGTEVTLGFATCVARTVDMLRALRTPAASHERFLVVEVMGRHSGASCLWPSLLAGAERALIAEVPFVAEQLASLLVADRTSSPSRSAMVVVSEGARFAQGAVLEDGEADGYGHRKLGGIGAEVAAALTRATRVQCVEQRLGYLVRAGTPDAADVLLAHGFASVAARLLREQQYGRMVAVKGGRYAAVPIAEALRRPVLDVAGLYDTAALRPRLRRAEGLGMWPTG